MNDVPLELHISQPAPRGLTARLLMSSGYDYVRSVEGVITNHSIPIRGALKLHRRICLRGGFPERLRGCEFGRGRVCLERVRSVRTMFSVDELRDGR